MEGGGGVISAGRFSNKGRDRDTVRRGKTNAATDVCRRDHLCWDRVELQEEGVKEKGEARRDGGEEEG